jgi:hypothetical protein
MCHVDYHKVFKTRRQRDNPTMKPAVRVIIILVVALSAMLIAPSASAAADGPSLTVTPDTDLVDQQTVTVTSNGLIAIIAFPGEIVPTLHECEPEFPASAVFPIDFGNDVVSPMLQQHCVSLGSFPPTGSLVTSRTVAVLRAFTTTNGVAVQCGISHGDCLFVAAGAVSGFAGLSSAPISFAPLTPRSFADCMHGRWRNVTDAQGRPFKNQGRCISYVLHHRSRRR